VAPLPVLQRVRLFPRSDPSVRYHHLGNVGSVDVPVLQPHQSPDFLINPFCSVLHGLLLNDPIRRRARDNTEILEDPRGK
jgi:hypothetical protein